MKAATLFDIPTLLFKEFSVLETRTFKVIQDLTPQLSISCGRSTISGETGPFTIVDVGTFSPDAPLGKSTHLMVYAEQFDAREYLGREAQMKPLLAIAARVDDPTYSKLSMDHFRWEEGKGYWVPETLEVAYFYQRKYHGNIISQNGDWEFGLLLAIQQKAHELAKTIPIRGHWQSEWKAGDYTRNPTKVA